MAITMTAVTAGYFDGGRNLTRGHQFFSNAVLETILAAARVDLASQDARITVVEGLVAGMDQKASVDLATAAALPACTAAGAGVGKTLTGDANGQLTVDGSALVVGDIGKRVLVKNQVAGKDNGLYTITAPGDAGTPFVLTRATDADGASEMTANLFVWVETGTANADTAWVLTTDDPFTIDTDALTFAQYSSSALALAMERGGDFEIDGDHLAITFNPSNSTPAITPAEAAHIDDLAAHLYGIDVVLGAHEARINDDFKRSVRLATAGALAAYTQAGAGAGATLTANAVGAETIDGVAVVLNDRVLVNELGTGGASSDCGIYTVTTVGTGGVAQVLTRATDADADAEVTCGLVIRVEEGTVYAGSEFVLATTGAIVVDTTNLTFTADNSITHAADHERAGLFEIDGDHLDIDFTPVFYVPTTDPAEAANVDDLAAHLAGIDDSIGTRDHKQSVRLATAGALAAYTQAGSGVGATLTANAVGVENIDGVAVALNDRVLVNELGTGGASSDCGIYTVTTVGTGGAAQVLTRAVDADESAELAAGLVVNVEEGTANGGARFRLETTGTIIVDTTALSFERFDIYAPVGDIADIGGAAGAGTAETAARGDHVHNLANLVTLMAHEGSNNVSGNPAAAGTIGTHRCVDYDDGGAVLDEEYAWESRMPSHYGGGTMTVKLYYAAAAAAGDVKWDVAFERIQLLTLDIDAGDSWDTEKTTTDTVPGTAGHVTTSDFTFTSAEADDLAAGELFRILVRRDTTDAADTTAGDVSLLAIEISQ